MASIRSDVSCKHRIISTAVHSPPDLLFGFICWKSASVYNTKSTNRTQTAGAFILGSFLQVTNKQFKRGRTGEVSGQGNLSSFLQRLRSELFDSLQYL